MERCLSYELIDTIIKQEITTGALEDTEDNMCGSLYQTMEDTIHKSIEELGANT